MPLSPGHEYGDSACVCPRMTMGSSSSVCVCVCVCVCVWACVGRGVINIV